MLLRSHNFISMRWKFYTCVSSVYDFPTISGKTVLYIVLVGAISIFTVLKISSIIFNTAKMGFLISIISEYSDGKRYRQSVYSLLSLDVVFGNISTDSRRQWWKIGRSDFIQGTEYCNQLILYIIFPKADINFNANARGITVNQHSTTQRHNENGFFLFMLRLCFLCLGRVSIL